MIRGQSSEFDAVLVKFIISRDPEICQNHCASSCMYVYMTFASLSYTWYLRLCSFGTSYLSLRYSVPRGLHMPRYVLGGQSLRVSSPSA